MRRATFSTISQWAISSGPKFQGPFTFPWNIAYFQPIWLCPLTKQKLKQGSIFYHPKQCSVVREAPQNCHKFVLFDFPKIANLTTLAPVDPECVEKPWHRCRCRTLKSPGFTTLTWSSLLGYLFNAFWSLYVHCVIRINSASKGLFWVWQHHRNRWISASF